MKSYISFKVLLLIAILLSCLFTASAYALTPEEENQRLVEGAKREGKLVFYTSMPTAEFMPIVNQFQKKYPFIKVEPFRGSAKDITTRILLESRMNEYRLDVLKTSGMPVALIQQQGLLARYISPEARFYPKESQDPEGYWTSIYYNDFVFGYNRKMVGPDDIPRTYEDLLLPKWKGKIGLSPEQYEWFANMLKIFGKEKGLNYMRRLAAQKLQYRKGNSLQAQLVAAGEYPLAMVYGYKLEQMKDDGAPVERANLTPMICSLQPIAIAAHAPHPNAAKLYIDFVLSREQQEKIKAFHRIPGRTDIGTNPATLINIKRWVSDPKIVKDYKENVEEFNKTFLTK
jgi:iron(III) transport system substrate-binding protein